MPSRRRGPILPRSKTDPMGTDALERRAMRDFERRLKRIGKEYVRILNLIPAEPIKVNRSYTFRVDGTTITTLLSDVSLFVDFVLMEGGQSSLWFYEAYVGVAAARGLAQEFQNLSVQSPIYRAAKHSLAEVTNSEPYLRRMSLLAAREFEEMQGFAGTVKADMARVLTDGVARGLNPREVARNLTEQIGIETKRAHRIARTEIGTALRRARLDEADEAAEELNLLSMEMHQSALSPTTRATHAARHGRLFTTDEQREWWAQNTNSINCKCTTVTVLVDKDGKPLVPEIVERARRNALGDEIDSGSDDGSRSLQHAFTHDGQKFSANPLRRAGGEQHNLVNFGDSTEADFALYRKTLDPILEGEVERVSDEIQTLRLESIQTFQSTIHTPSSEFTPSSEPATIFDLGGQYYVKDGNHRLVRDWLDGKEEVRVRVVKWR